MYALQPDSVALHGSVLTATVVNEEVEPNVPLKLTVTMYNGFMRLHLNEVAETERYEVPNVLMDLQPLKVPATMDKGSDALTLQAGQIKAVIKFWPVHVDIWQGGTLAMSLNTRQMLNFEHTREKKVFNLRLPPSLRALRTFPCSAHKRKSLGGQGRTTASSLGPASLG